MLSSGRIDKKQICRGQKSQDSDDVKGTQVVGVDGDVERELRQVVGCCVKERQGPFTVQLPCAPCAPDYTGLHQIAYTCQLLA